MNETPEEREQRLAEMSERDKLGRRLKRVESAELRRQSRRVQFLAIERNVWAGWAEHLAAVDTDGELPATIEARTLAADALRGLAAALGVEIRTEWVDAG